MNRFKNILCVLTAGESSHIALKRAVALAEHNQARLHVISVMPSVSIGMGMSEGGPISAELEATMVKARTEEVSGLVEQHRGQMMPQTRVLVGLQFLEIIRDVLRHDCDLVIKAPDVQEWMEHLLGSEDMHLLRKCPCPVWLIKPTAPKTYRRILAAVDVSEIYPQPEKKPRRALNQQIIEMAASVAREDTAELHVVHSWHVFAESALRGALMEMQEISVNALVETVRQQREANLNGLIQSTIGDLNSEGLQHPEPQSHLVKGRARREIPALVKTLDADLVVMGTVARTGIPGFFTGNTAESILSQLDCSVLAIKPPGFETPVTLP